MVKRDTVVDPLPFIHQWLQKLTELIDPSNHDNCKQQERKLFKFMFGLIVAIFAIQILVWGLGDVLSSALVSAGLADLHWLGLPIYATGDRPIAWIAVGTRPIGLIAIGDVAIGGFAIGGGACGICAIGGGACGVFAFGGGALGLIGAAGGGALGFVVAFGGCAIGYYAFGGLAIGGIAYAGNGIAKGVYVASGRQAEDLIGSTKW